MFLKLVKNLTIPIVGVCQKYFSNINLKRKDKDIQELIEYAKTMKIEDEVRTYLEVLL